MQPSSQLKPTTGGNSALSNEIRKSKWNVATEKWGKGKENSAPQPLDNEPSDKWRMARSPVKENSFSIQQRNWNRFLTPVVPSENERNFRSSSVKTIEAPMDRWQIESTETFLSDMSEENVIFVD